MDGVRVLTHWQPSELTEKTILREFRELLLSLGLTPVQMIVGIDVRSPEYQRAFPDHSVAMKWHQDNRGLHKPQLLICWSNYMPTMVRNEAGEIFEPAPGSVLVVDNSTMEHCGPPGLNKTDDRWFVRTIIDKDEETSKLLRGDD